MIGQLSDLLKQGIVEDEQNLSFSFLNLRSFGALMWLLSVDLIYESGI